ncbi:uncharacterized protein B0H18DRAFT_1039469, partial [Fomitopsis serialis]|uniref:uncharacterized protein n=1 Tax=Fomitopsis serialis TaxID=139415 RepID=UPI0020081F7D
NRCLGAPSTFILHPRIRRNLQAVLHGSYAFSRKVSCASLPALELLTTGRISGTLDPIGMSA